MAILTIADFLSGEAETVLEKNAVRAAYYYDIGDGFYRFLLREFNINIDFIPIEAEVRVSIRRVLSYYVSCQLASDKMGTTVRRNNEGVDEDPWEKRMDAWCKKYERLMKDLSSDDFYDPNNLPPDDEATTGNPLVSEWNRS